MNTTFTNMDQEQERVRTGRNQYEPNPWLEHTGWERYLPSDHKVVVNALLNTLVNALLNTLVNTLEYTLEYSLEYLSNILSYIMASLTFWLRYSSILCRKAFLFVFT
jgi:hypothetical protein